MLTSYMVKMFIKNISLFNSIDLMNQLRNIFLCHMAYITRCALTNASFWKSGSFMFFSSFSKTLSVHEFIVDCTLCLTTCTKFNFSIYTTSQSTQNIYCLIRGIFGYNFQNKFFYFHQKVCWVFAKMKSAHILQSA